MRWWGWAILIIVVWWIILNPSEAAADWHAFTTFMHDVLTRQTPP